MANPASAGTLTGGMQFPVFQIDINRPIFTCAPFFACHFYLVHAYFSLIWFAPQTLNGRIGTEQEQNRDSIETEQKPNQN